MATLLADRDPPWRQDNLVAITYKQALYARNPRLLQILPQVHGRYTPPGILLLKKKISLAS
ncbi:unnamed protein product [Absidia cylindrospora]